MDSEITCVNITWWVAILRKCENIKFPQIWQLHLHPNSNACCQPNKNIFLNDFFACCFTKITCNTYTYFEIMMCILCKKVLRGWLEDCLTDWAETWLYLAIRIVSMVLYSWMFEYLSSFCDHTVDLFNIFFIYVVDIVDKYLRWWVVVVVVGSGSCCYCRCRYLL